MPYVYRRPCLRHWRRRSFRAPSGASTVSLSASMKTVVMSATGFIGAVRIAGFSQIHASMNTTSFGQLSLSAMIYARSMLIILPTLTASLIASSVTRVTSVGQLTNISQLTGRIITASRAAGMIGANATLAARLVIVAYTKGATIGAVSLLGRTFSSIKSVISSPNSIQLIGRIFTAMRGIAAPVGALSIAARTVTQAKGVSSIVGATGLSGQIIAGAKSVATLAGFLPLINLIGHASSAVKGNATVTISGVVSLFRRVFPIMETRVVVPNVENRTVETGS